MSETYSVAILCKNKHGLMERDGSIPDSYWVTNWGQFYSLDDINFESVEKHCLKAGSLGYGYYYGHNSRNLTSNRCRTVLKEF